MELSTKYPVYYMDKDNLLLPLKELASVAEEAIELFLNETGAQKVNIVAWSRAGLAARIIACDMPDKVASVTTVCTPHRGLRGTDGIMGKLVKKCWYKLVGTAPKAFELAVKTMSPLYMQGFNERYPNVEDIFYQSAACAMHPETDKRLSAANNILEITDGENDGVVSVYSALWGQYGRIYRGVSHLDAAEKDFPELIENLIQLGL